MLHHILLYIGLLARPVLLLKIRVVTWNVSDNEKSFSETNMINVLGLNKLKKSHTEDIFAIGLQENCWMCNPKNLHHIADRFLKIINKKSSSKYGVIAIEGTHNTTRCEGSCKLFHGSSIVLVIAKISLGNRSKTFIHRGTCSANLYKNKEKGMAGIKFSPLNGWKSICFATAHLDANKPESRRNCFKDFFVTAGKQVNWNKCDFHFIFGDFNTRTGPNEKKKKKSGKYVPESTNFNPLHIKDEFTGSKPHGTDLKWNKNLLTYINSAAQSEKKKLTYNEKNITFIPTFSIKNSAKECAGKFPCYRMDRPKSWTDRIIFTHGTCHVYQALDADFSDHLPVYGEFTVNL